MLRLESIFLFSRRPMSYVLCPLAFTNESLRDSVLTSRESSLTYVAFGLTESF